MDKKYNITLSSVLIIFFSGLLLSSLAGYALLNKEKKIIQRDLQTDIKQRVVALHRELVINLEIAQSLSILFRGDNSPSYEQFDLEASLILKRFEGIHSLSWEPKVTSQEREGFELQQQLFLPGFTISERTDKDNMVTASERSIYYPTLYISPSEGNQTAIGFDLGSNSTRLAALNKSRNTAKTVATASIMLVQEQEVKKAVITFIPIFRWLSSTQEQRNANLRGYISAVFKIQEIFHRAVLFEDPLGINMKLVDTTNSKVGELLLHHVSRNGSQTNNDYIYEYNLPDLWGRQWHIEGIATQYYLDQRKSYLSQAIFFTGTIFTLFICLYLYFISQQNKLIKKTVRDETKVLSRANLKLQRLSDIDALTGIANRRQMDSYLKAQWKKAVKNKDSISVLLIDIDYFKLYNDNYGHPAGDKVLIQVAQAIDCVTRRNDDLTARFGGEEFALILSNTSDVDCIAKQCLQAIVDLKIVHGYSTASEYLSISIGCCTLAPRILSGHEVLVDLADKALYKAKFAGRNCIKHFIEEPSDVIHMQKGFKR